MDQPLTGQTILVAGSSGELGAGIVQHLAREGARVIIHYDHDPESAQTLLQHAEGNGYLIQADLLSQEGPFELWSKAVQAAGRIDALVNNAATRTEVSIEAPALDWKAVWQKEFQMNFFAAADLCKEALKHFRQNQGGRIVNMCSRSGQRGYVAEAMAYGASKAALINLTKSIARSFGPDGVVAVAIAPGWVKDEMAEQYIATYGKEAAVADIPIGEIVSPDEIAELVAFVLRNSQRSLNGATLDVNGGSYIR